MAGDLPDARTRLHPGPIATDKIAIILREDPSRLDMATPPTSSPAPATDARPRVVDEPTRRSPWGPTAQLGRVLWSLVYHLLWRHVPTGWTAPRNAILRCFRARIGRRVVIHRSARIEVPWNVAVDDDARVCQGAILYSLGRISIGPRSLVGPYAHLCAGTHDYTSSNFDLRRQPIVIEADCVVLSGVFVGPDVTLGRGCVVRERASVYADTEPDTIYEGNPARAVGPREGSA
jgi:putative colanic acid biosynthesis acetyltransferase WcaF